VTPTFVLRILSPKRGSRLIDLVVEQALLLKHVIYLLELISVLLNWTFSFRMSEKMEAVEGFF